jgi:hypothetical protein
MENQFLKVEGQTHLVRDTNTNAIINTNTNGYKEYVSIRNAKSREIGRIDNIENELNGVKSDLNEIKFLLRKLINEP